MRSLLASTLLLALAAGCDQGGAPGQTNDSAGASASLNNVTFHLPGMS